MSKFSMRRNRILPGPLRVLRQRRATDGLLAPLAVMASALALTLAVFPHLYPQAPTQVSAASVPTAEAAATVATSSATPVRSIAEPPMTGAVAVAEPAPALSAPAAGSEARPTAASLAPERAAVPSRSEPVRVAAASETVRPAKPNPASAGTGKPTAEASLFQLDRLPVLSVDGADLGDAADSSPAPARARPKPVRSRTTASSRAAEPAAFAEPAQP